MYAGTMLTDATEQSSAGYNPTGRIDAGSGLLEAYKQHGDALGEHIVGEIAFAVVDYTAQALVIGRAGVGASPLYIAIKGGEMGAATSALSLQKLGFEEPEALRINQTLKVRAQSGY
jgi:asparagine synthetase B (glutamine-hydrolysing)